MLGILRLLLKQASDLETKAEEAPNDAELAENAKTRGLSDVVPQQRGSQSSFGAMQ